MRVDADRKFAALAGGGQVQMPLIKKCWSPRFGMASAQPWDYMNPDLPKFPGQPQT